MRKFHDDGPNRLKELLDLPDSTVPIFISHDINVFTLHRVVSAFDFSRSHSVDATSCGFFTRFRTI